MNDPTIDARFASRYRVERLLGQGGMGRVYRAWDCLGMQHVALKVVREDLVDRPDLPHRFRREIRATSRIDHPNVARILDFGQGERQQPYLAMEYVPGVPASQRLTHAGPFAVDQALSILRQIADALAAAHACQVVHRDLKPGNVLLQGSKDRPTVKIVDFGLAKILGLQGGSLVTPLGQLFGTAAYIAPERAADSEIDARADIYSFGVLAFEMLTGRVPFEGSIFEVIAAHLQQPPPLPTEVAPAQKIPPALEQVVLRCLSKAPDQRYQTAHALGDQLRRMAP